MKNYFVYIAFVISFIFFLPLCLLGQDIESELNKAIPDCKSVATNSQRLLAENPEMSTDSIYHILDVWQSFCGEVEPIRRLRILIDIQEGNYRDSSMQSYMDLYYYQYKNRVLYAQKDNYYDYSPYYLDHVKLRSAFDQRTESIANKMKEVYPQDSEEFLIALLFSGDVEAYRYKSASKTYSESTWAQKSFRNNYFGEGYNSSFYVAAHAGIWMPIGKLNEHFNSSPQLGFSLGYIQSDNLKYDLKFLFVILSQKELLSFSVDDEVQEVNDYSLVNIIFSGTKTFGYKEKTLFDLTGGIGVSVLDTGIEKPSNNKESSNYSTTSPSVELGLGMRRKVGKKRNSIALNISLQYSPYNLSSMIVDKIGTLNLNSTVSYTF